MINSKLNLIVDGNWLLMTHLSIMTKKYETEDEITKRLPLSFLRSIKTMLYKVPNIYNVVIVADNRTWRKRVDLPSVLKDKYKGQREHKDNFNWSSFYIAYDSF